MKDGETTRMVSIGLPNRKFNKLCFVNSDDPKLGGKIYINENWRSINEKPLAWDEAKIALDQVEALLYSFYGSEKMYRLIKNRKAIKTMSQETLTKYMADPELNDELDASFALDLIYEFRGYFDLKIKP